MSRFVNSCLKPLSAAVSLGGIAGAYTATAAIADTAHDATTSKVNDARSSTQGAEGQSVTSHSVEHIHVIGHPFNTMRTSNDMGRMPQDVMHTAQTIDVVPRELIQQQNAKSLDEALRNVPGITSSVGEGAGGMSGDQFLIRGFPAQNDIYEDGLRDFGVYTRDSFFQDSVNVIKGPSSEVFGNGTTGGAINIVTKSPTLKNHYNADFSGGSANYYRGTVDINQRIDKTTAFRIEGMGTSNNVEGRDYAAAHRWGIAPSIAFGLGTKTTVVLQVMHQSSDNVPDYGVPVTKLPGQTMGRPITEKKSLGVSRDNWYGKKQDHDNSEDTMETLRLTHKFNSHLTLHNDLRFGEYSRDFAASSPQCANAQCSEIQLYNPGYKKVTSSYGLNGGPMPYKQSSWSFQDVASMQADFNTGFLKHQLVTGFDFEYVEDSRRQYAYDAMGAGRAIPWQNTASPQRDTYQYATCRADSGSCWKNTNYSLGRPDSSGYGFDTGLFLYDQIWFNKWLSVKGGLRWDHWQTMYKTWGADAQTTDESVKSYGKAPSKAADYHNSTDVVNPTASLLFTPNNWQTFYFTYASSTTPMGMYVTNGSIPVRPASNGQVATQPERSRLYEVGTKMSLLHDRLGATISLFRLDKSNALTSDPISGQVQATGIQERNQGLELSLGGMILPGWNVSATYALYDPRQTSGVNKGRNIQYVPHNQATLWSAYEAFPGKPWNFTIGGGVTWRQGVYLTLANDAKVPANVEFDSVLSHRINRHWVVSLNGYNLSNRLNYNSLFTGRVTPAPGRTFLGRLSMEY